MFARLLPLAAAALALVLTSANLHAQTAGTRRSDARAVPVINKDSGKLEAVLLLEPATTGAGSAARQRVRPVAYLASW